MFVFGELTVVSFCYVSPLGIVIFVIILVVVVALEGVVVALFVFILEGIVPFVTNLLFWLVDVVVVLLLILLEFDIFAVVVTLCLIRLLLVLAEDKQKWIKS